MRYAAVTGNLIPETKETPCDFVAKRLSSLLSFNSAQVLPIRRVRQIPAEEPIQGTLQIGSSAWTRRRQNSLIGLRHSPRPRHVLKRNIASIFSGRPTIAPSPRRTMGARKN